MTNLRTLSAIHYGTNIRGQCPDHVVAKTNENTELKMKYLITGGAGFIGSNTAEHLLKEGHQVRILDNFSSGKRDNLARFLNNIELLEGDIRDTGLVGKAVQGVDYVLHLAAMPSVPKSIADPLSSNEINVGGTLNVLEASRRNGVKKFVLASSAAIYGDSPELPKRENMLPNPLSPYAIQKLVGEYYCKVFWELYDLPTVALRYFNVFGPRQDPQGDYASVIPKFITVALADGKPVVFGDGLQSRDFVYIQDCVQANILAATRDTMVGEAFNVAAGKTYTLNELLDALRAVTGKPIQAVYDAPRPGDIVHSSASVVKLIQQGYQPSVDLETGLKRTVEYFGSKRD